VLETSATTHPRCRCVLPERYERAEWYRLAAMLIGVPEGSGFILLSSDQLGNKALHLGWLTIPVPSTHAC
jgi:hypothetical protein